MTMDTKVDVLMGLDRLILEGPEEFIKQTKNETLKQIYDNGGKDKIIPSILYSVSEGEDMLNRAEKAILSGLAIIMHPDFDLEDAKRMSDALQDVIKASKNRDDTAVMRSYKSHLDREKEFKTIPQKSAVCRKVLRSMFGHALTDQDMLNKFLDSTGSIGKADAILKAVSIMRKALKDGLKSVIESDLFASGDVIVDESDKEVLMEQAEFAEITEGRLKNAGALALQVSGSNTLFKDCPGIGMMFKVIAMISLGGNKKEETTRFFEVFSKTYKDMTVSPPRDMTIVFNYLNRFVNEEEDPNELVLELLDEIEKESVLIITADGE